MSPSDAGAGRPISLLVTCEHAGRDVPSNYIPLFAGAGGALESHRGYDIGALGVAMRLGSRLPAPVLPCNVTRLLVDANRSPGHAQLFSEFTASLPQHQKDAIVAEYHTPHRARVARAIDAAVSTGHRVIHIGVHSFADALDGIVRNVDIGILFDPARNAEQSLCTPWTRQLRRARADLRVRANEPYRGIDDGLTTTLRAAFPDPYYMGVEIEVRQGLLPDESHQHVLADFLASTLGVVVPTRTQPVL